MGSGKKNLSLFTRYFPLRRAAQLLRRSRLYKMLSAHCDIEFVAADLDLLTFLDRIAISIGAEVHSRLAPAVADRL